MMQGMAMNFVFLTLIVARGHGSSEFKQNLYGWFGVACRQEIFGGNLF